MHAMPLNYKLVNVHRLFKSLCCQLPGREKTVDAGKSGPQLVWPGQKRTGLLFSNSLDQR